MFCSFAFLYFIIKKTKYQNLGKYGFASIFIVAFSIVPLNIVIEELSFQEVKNQLNNSIDNELKVLVNERNPEFNYEKLFEKIKNKDFFSFRNHSENTTEFKIDIIENDQIFSISLWRDSIDSTKYWIYNNNHDYELEIGNIKTDLLDKY